MEFWKWAYDNQYATKGDLKEAVTLDDLTPVEYTTVTGEVYTA